MAASKPTFWLSERSHVAFDDAVPELMVVPEAPLAELLFAVVLAALVISEVLLAVPAEALFVV